MFDTDHVGRRKGKYKYDREALRETIKEIPFKGRRTYRRLAAKLNLHVSTTHLLEKGRKTVNRDGVILKKTRFSLKPTLTEQQKLWRYSFAYGEILTSSLRSRRGQSKVPCFKGQYDKVHIDEKWFFLTTDRENYLMVEGEEAPTRRVRHKKYMTKVMSSVHKLDQGGIIMPRGGGMER